MRRVNCLALCTSFLFFAPAIAQEKSKEPALIELAGGKLVMKAPAEWKVEKPKSNIVQYEFSAPADAKETDEKVRITVMGAGGGVEANLQRWYGQLSQPSGKPTKDVAKLEVMDVAGQKIHFVDVTGTFADTMGAGPFSGKPAVKRENYRMLGAIVETEKLGMYFVKATGPNDACEKLVEGFKKMLKGLEAK